MAAFEDAKPVKLTFEVPASIHRDLVTYAEILARQTGQSISDPAKLIAPMLTRFMATDRAFAKARRARQRPGRNERLCSFRGFRAGPYPWCGGAMLNTALILGEKHPWEDNYALGRVPLKAAKNFLSENLTVGGNFAEYVTPGELSSPDDLPIGQGAIIRQGTGCGLPRRPTKASPLFSLV